MTASRVFSVFCPFTFVPFLNPSVLHNRERHFSLVQRPGLVAPFPVICSIISASEPRACPALCLVARPSDGPLRWRWRKTVTLARHLPSGLVVGLVVGLSFWSSILHQFLPSSSAHLLLPFRTGLTLHRKLLYRGRSFPEQNIWGPGGKSSRPRPHTRKERPAEQQQRTWKAHTQQHIKPARATHARLPIPSR